MTQPPIFRSAYAAGAVTPAQVLAFHGLHFGAAVMQDPPPEPQQPEGVTDEEWAALGDPGKRAIVRERERATKAEADLAAARAPKPAPPKVTPPPATPPANPAGGDATDIEAIVKQAIAAAIAPLQQAQQQRDAADAARLVSDAITTAATGRMHDASDALANIDPAAVVDANGRPDAAKIAAAIDEVGKAKPYLMRTDRRFPAEGHMLGGPSAPVVSEEARVAAAAVKMANAAGVKAPKAS